MGYTTNPFGDASLLPVFVSDVTSPSGQVWTEGDYTSGAVQNAYASNIQTLYNLFNTPSPANFTGTGVGQDGYNAQQAFANLKQLALNGILDSGPNSNNTGKTYFLTNQMATSLDLLVRSFNAVGVTDPTAAGSITAADLQKWKDLSLVSTGIQDTFSAALAAVPANTSLQALIELDYVATGNTLINEQLSSLNSALTTTSNVLTSLTNVQNIFNRMIVQPPSNFNFNFTPTVTANGTTDYQTAYGKVASTIFNKPIGILVSSTLILYNTHGVPSNLNLPQGLSIFNELLAIKTSLINFLSGLASAVGPTGVNDPNSIYNAVKKMIHSFSVSFGFSAGGTSFVAANASMSDTDKAKSIFRFLEDNNNTQFAVTGRTAGDTQQALTTAITAAQGLNDTQKENVRQFLFVFEEFYKSASAMLQSITQIIQKMAQNISK